MTSHFPFFQNAVSLATSLQSRDDTRIESWYKLVIKDGKKYIIKRKIKRNDKKEDTLRPNRNKNS